ncbi:MAG: ATP-grasp domain-containing protein [Parachlamydiaceae bacterium]
MSLRNILLTAARSPVTLELARLLHSAGHRVFVADTTKLNTSRFSNSVEKTFLIPSPRFFPDEFLSSLIKITKEEGIHLVIPIYEEILLLARNSHLFPKSCSVFTSSFDLLLELHNKWLFQKKLESFGIEIPKTFLIEKQEDLKKIDFSHDYALKACYSRASLSLKKISAEQAIAPFEIEEHNPWIAQEWLEGNKFCTYSICQNGKIKAHATYPVKYAIDGNSCLIFEAFNHPKILNWVENFIQKINFTGQIAFDFIQLANGKLYAIECNPRATSGVHLFREKDRLDQAFFNLNDSPILAQEGTQKQILHGMLMYGWRKSSFPSNNASNFFKHLFSIRDVVYSLKDPLPFLASPLIFREIWNTSKKYNITIPAAFTFDYEWNGK